MSVGIRKTPSQNREQARELVERLVAIADTMNEVRDRGGILRVLERAQVGDKQRSSVVRATERLRDQAIAVIVAIGDQRRAEGSAVPLCLLPGAPATDNDSADTLT
jgi:hypothetical protein